MPDLKEETRVSGIEEMHATQVAASNGKSAVKSRGRKSEELTAALLTVSFSGLRRAASLDARPGDVLKAPPGGCRHLDNRTTEDEINLKPSKRKPRGGRRDGKREQVRLVRPVANDGKPSGDLSFGMGQRKIGLRINSLRIRYAQAEE